MAVGELQVFETAAENLEITPRPALQANLTIGKPAQLLSADAVRGLGPSVEAVAARGVDGVATTWAQAAGEYAWTFQLDLQEAVTLRRIKVTFALGVWATAYNVLVSSDGDNWKNVAQVTNNTSAGLKPHAFAATQARYVRVQAVKPDGPNQPGNQMGIAEVQVFEE